MVIEWSASIGHFRALVNSVVNYSFATCRFGELLVASTCRGVCCVEFADGCRTSAVASLSARFPGVRFDYHRDGFQTQVLDSMSFAAGCFREVRLHLKATDFQRKVWEALMEIPMGTTEAYGDIAARIGNPRACRAVGHAVGANPVALLIPCHRVVCASGETGNYRWGSGRKRQILDYERKICSESHTKPQD